MNMKIIDKKIEDILNSEEINSKFISAKHNQLNIQCNILKENFFLDSYNYFPITEEYFSFLEIFTWGEKLKYKNFYSDNFNRNLGAPEKSRTPNLQIRSLALYPIELRALFVFIFFFKFS